MHSPSHLTCTSPMMSSMTTSYWTTKSAMIPELEKADWSCSVGQKVTRTQVSPLSIRVDGGESASPVWVGWGGVGWYAGLTSRSQARGRQKKQCLRRLRSNLCITCCSSCLQRPFTCPTATLLPLQILKPKPPALPLPASPPSLANPALPSAPRLWQSGPPVQLCPGCLAIHPDAQAHVPG